MAIIRCPILFSQYFGLNPDVLDYEGIFNPILNSDTRLFIDPLLLVKSENQLFKNQAASELKEYYKNIISLLEISKSNRDRAYNTAVEQLPLKEITGTCLGYGANSISGRGIPLNKAKEIINTIKEIIEIGIINPELFIILPLFNKGMGADTISDITTVAIMNTLLNFTANIAIKLNIKTEKYCYKGEEFEIIRNPLRKTSSPLLLLPYDILRSLPFASTWEEIVSASYENQILRDRFNRYLSMIVKEKTEAAKMRALQGVMKNKKGISTLFEIIKNSKINPYEYNFYKEKISYIHPTKEIILNNPLDLSSIKNDKYNFNIIIKKIIEQFKFLIEHKGANKLLWKDNSTPNKENIAQKMFLMVAESYCENNNIDINPETDTGIGFVDFKFSKGFSKKIILEIKLSTNSEVINGYTTQLKLYMQSEKTLTGYYIVIDVGNMGRKFAKLTDI